MFPTRLAAATLLVLLGWCLHAAVEAAEPERVKLAEAWRALPEPPITPYTGPFGGDARAFVGKLPQELVAAFFDWKRLGTYRPEDDTRPINPEFERAVLEDWRRMGYNCAYKGNVWTFRSGRWLKKQGMLGAIDQTLWAARGPAPLHYDGTEARRRNEACGSFFAKENFDAGVTLLANYVNNYGDPDMFRVGGAYITSSWDEVGLRTRRTIDYRPEAVAEYRRFLRSVWFRDASPQRDTNRDGRTYNQFTGERLSEWDQVEPPVLSPRYYQNPQPVDEKWKRPGATKLWTDFHRFYTFEFFRRINAQVRRTSGKWVQCYPFPQAFIVWPGINAFFGMSSYWNSRQNMIITVEQCWPDHPAMALAYAHSDRLARQNQNVVMGWSWFWFADEARDMYDGPGDLERALARMMGHRVDGIHHWLYSPQYRGRLQEQRLQLAYWHNFLAAHYATFLARSAPPDPEVALLAPDYTGYFYRIYQYPKMDYAYTAGALIEAQIPFEIVSEEEIELDRNALKPYKAVYVVSSQWTTPTIRRRLAEFIERGGYVFADTDSLSLDVPTAGRNDFLEKQFGVRILRKHKNPFFPSALTPQEESWAAELHGSGLVAFQSHDVHKPGVYSKLWTAQGGKAVRNEETWKLLDAMMARMPRRGAAGLAQGPIDMRSPPQITYAEAVGPAEGLTTYGEIVVGTPTEGEPIAHYGNEVCGVETERTVWLGTQPGMSLHAIAPRMSLSRTTDPCNPFLTETPTQYEPHRPYVELLAYLARKAGVRALVTLRLGEQIPCNLEVLPRVDEKGNLMVFVINHDATDAAYRVTIDPDYVTGRLPAKSAAFNLLRREPIEQETDGQFDLRVPPHRVAVFFAGSPSVLAPIEAAQEELDAMDLSVPKYFADRPELNQAPWGVPPVPEK